MPINSINKVITVNAGIINLVKENSIKSSTVLARSRVVWVAGYNFIVYKRWTFKSSFNKRWTFKSSFNRANLMCPLAVNRVVEILRKGLNTPYLCFGSFGAGAKGYCFL